MTPPTIQALGIVQEWSGTSWKTTGDVEGVGWLTAWGPSLPTALEALQVLAARPMAEAGDVVEDREVEELVWKALTDHHPSTP